MTDERSKADEAWIDALKGKPADGNEDGATEARILRAAIEAQDQLTSERLSDEDIELAKQKLMTRLGGDSIGTSDDASSEQSSVVDLSSRRPANARRSIWQQNPAMLLAASVAFVAIVLMVLRNPDLPDGQMLIMSYGEVETLRGSSDETVLAVENPADFGRELGGRLTEREIPFVLSADSPDSLERSLSIQVDGVPNRAGVEETLEELGLAMPPTSVLLIRLVPE